MTPAERLLAAADLLDKLAWTATPGPWVEAGIGDYGWSVTAIDHRSRFGVETEDSEQGKADAAYIAAMHPEIGKDLAIAMRSASRSVSKRKHRGLDPNRVDGLLLQIADQLLVASSVLAEP